MTPVSVSIGDVLLPRELTPQGGQTSSSATSDDYTCGPGRPCQNGACCGQSGWCGYEPKYCGKGCLSNCNAKAECGKYANLPGKTCPLNVCCSEFGFCGTTSEYCKKGCQSKCDQPKPSVSKTNVQQKIIAYWEAWNENKPCGHMAPDDIPVHDITHLIYSFGFITPGDFRITNMPDVKPGLFREIGMLKNKNPDLKIQIALGGWTHNDPGKWQKVFSDMVSTAEGRTKFIQNLLGFIRQYGYDGVDFDWEYPGAKDRGGKDEDGMHDYVDWVNLMSYDLHGVWDRDNPIGNKILGHTNVTEIDLALDLFWRNDIPPGDIVLGVGFYGRSFKLQNPGCWKPGCRFSGPGDKGKCTDTAGFLSYSEIMDLIKTSGAKATYDKGAKVNYMTYGDNSWISFDDERTFGEKIEFANKRGLGGLMIWAIDLDDSKNTALSALTGRGELGEGNFLGFGSRMPNFQQGFSSDDASQCRVSECGETCRVGETAVGRASTDFGREECSGSSSNARYICCPAWSSLTEDTCYWTKGTGGAKTDCAGKCGPGNMKKYLEICTWSSCGGSCPPERPHVLTTDTGGPLGGKRCRQSVDFESGAMWYAKRKLCCPKKDSFKNCNWKYGSFCSQQCGNGQITLDLDPQGPGTRIGGFCHNGRQQSLCCDPPGNKKQPLLPVELEKIFPKEYFPPADATTNFELRTFGQGANNMDPDESGFAFFLISGSDTAVSSMSKRDNPGLHFLDCPPNLLETPLHEPQSARVICLSGTFEQCFGVDKNGVKGTIVKMPDECGAGTYARAISLVPSQNQTFPAAISHADPISAVYDFTFDYNMQLVRRDAGKISIRMDYSNVKGYWKAVVAGAPKLKRDLKNLVDRFFSDQQSDWFDAFDSIPLGGNGNLGDVGKQDISKLIYYNGEMCTGKDGREGQGIAVAIDGQTDVEFFHGFSMIATWDPAGKVEVHQSAGFLHIQGQTDASFTVAGIGTLDTSLKGSTNRLSRSSRRAISGQSVYHGWAGFDRYSEQEMSLSTQGDDSLEVGFNGYMRAKVKADWGKGNIHFPKADAKGEAESLQLDTESKLTSMEESKGEIMVTNSIKFGLDISLQFSGKFSSATGNLPDMSVAQRLGASFIMQDGEGEICLQTSVSQQNVAILDRGDFVGWNDSYETLLDQQRARVDKEECWNSRGDGNIEDGGDEKSDSKKKKKKRQNASVPYNGDYRNIMEGVPGPDELLGEQGRGEDKEKTELTCDACGSCYLNIELKIVDCCECAWLPPEDPSDRDLGSMPNPDSGIGTGISPWKRSSIEDAWSSPLQKLEARQLVGDINVSRKELKFWRRDVMVDDFELTFTVESEEYPMYPDWHVRPTTAPSWEASPDFPDVKKYFHNSSQSCTSFDVSQHTSWDVHYPWPKMTGERKAKTQYLQGKAYHAHYQTEHVFEGQTIPRFFDKWMPFKAVRKRPRFWTEQYILAPYEKWDSAPLIYKIVDELGSMEKQDRLAIFMSRSNGFKGSLFKGNNALTPDTFKKYEKGAEQLRAAREIGMVFSYMNLDTIWESYCDTYNGILHLFEEFDDWYAEITGGPKSDLRSEWPKFIRSELDGIVKRVRDNMRVLNRERKQATLIYTALWDEVMKIGGEMRKVKLDRTDKCLNLPASNVGPWTGP
ncbi:hypothetical protein CEP54_015977 [Fusarium duplospermum]|uniref:chitinase n=1 Tax=Fusarium duplospermum TaxID=1325734 RepID=A0A428NJD9_9HYPO|nr:hypothetical protein CEP54_015977 [Fusarium duplospermum]